MDWRTINGYFQVVEIKSTRKEGRRGKWEGKKRKRKAWLVTIILPLSQPASCASQRQTNRQWGSAYHTRRKTKKESNREHQEERERENTLTKVHKKGRERERSSIQSSKAYSFIYRKCPTRLKRPLLHHSKRRRWLS